MIHGSAEWREDRRGYLGASEVAIVLGESPYSSEFELWAQKMGLDEKPDSEVMDRGNNLEPLVGELYRQKTGAVVTKCEERFVIPNSCLAAHPDFWACADGPMYLVQAKTHTKWVANEYGDPDEMEDSLPDHEIIQVMVEMAATGYERVDVPVLFIESEKSAKALGMLYNRGAPVEELLPLVEGRFRIYTVRYDAEMAQAIIRAADLWWQKHIVGNLAPEPCGSKSESALIKRLFPRSNAQSIYAGPVAHAQVQELREIKAKIKALEAEESRIENCVKIEMGEADTLILMDGNKITYKQFPATFVEAHTRAGYRKFNWPYSWRKDKQ